MKLDELFEGEELEMNKHDLVALKNLITEILNGGELDADLLFYGVMMLNSIASAAREEN